MSCQHSSRKARQSQTIGHGISAPLKDERRDSWRAGCIERVQVRFGGEGLVFLGNQDLASYPTRSTGTLILSKERYAKCRRPQQSWVSPEIAASEDCRSKTCIGNCTIHSSTSERMCACTPMMGP